MNRRHFLAGAGMLALFSPMLSLAERVAAGTHVVGWYLQQGAGADRLVLELSGNATYRMFTLSSPPRVVIDLQQVSARVPGGQVHLEGSAVAGIRSGAHGDGLRVVLDMHRAVLPKASMSHGAAAGQRRLLVDLPLDGHAGAVAAVQRKPRAPIIAIDPGHGGRDPGAVSASDAYEKHVVLAIAAKLHGLLEKDPGFEPIMIRDDDHFVPLRERVLIAHQRKADLFVSIHADAAPTTSARGASVYVLSEHGATSAMARWMAESENSADRYAPLRDSALYSSDPMLSRVLVDMSMDATIASSLDLGRQMIGDLSQVTRIHQQHVDQAGFAVLKSPDIPSILVETGFMSNRDDCRRLLTDTHQQELAESLKSGISGYFRQHPLQHGEA